MKDMDLESAAEKLKQEYLEYLGRKKFACIAAKAAVAKQQVQIKVADHMGCPKDDRDILEFLYSFVDIYRASDEMYHSAAVIFKGPERVNEEIFEELMWKRLQALSDFDAELFPHDSRVDHEPSSKKYSFSLKEEAIFIIGLHPGSSRPTRRFKYPALVFNPHRQFEELREAGKYKRMQNVVRKRDLDFSGSVNPMLRDFGDSSEVYQYSGRVYDDEWKCPLKIKHSNEYHSSA